MFDVFQTEAASRPPAHAPLLPEAEQQILQDLMSDAMEETDSLQSHLLQQNGQTAFLYFLIKSHLYVSIHSSTLPFFLSDGN